MAWTKLAIAAGVAAAAVIALQWGKIETQQTEFDSLQSQLHLALQTNEQQLAAIKDLKTRDETMAQDLRDIARQRAQSPARTARAASPPAAANPPGAVPQAKGIGGMMENMMKDPEMMKAISEQQVQVIRAQYAPLVKQLNMAPDQRDAFYKLLSDNMTNAMVQGMALMSGTNNPDAASALAGSQKNMNDQMRLLLGDSGFAQFQDFQTSLPDRAMLEQMKTSFADNPLNDDQQQRLLQIMIDERKISASAVDPGTGRPVVPAANSAGQMEQAMQTQDQINQRVYQQAADFLSPSQLQSLGGSQSNFLNLTRVSMTMMQKMMGTNAADKLDGQ